MRIVAYNLSSRLNSALRAAFGKDVAIMKQKLDGESADTEAEIAIVTITSQVRPDALEKMKRLKAIVTASTGMDHIDPAYCKAHGITIRNCPSYSSNAVAELALALAFGGLRSMEKMLGFGRALAYPPSYFNHLGSELSGKKCAVLGTGQIGALIAKKLLALGCTVVAFSRSQNPELAGAGVAYFSLEGALAQADLVFIALPSTPETHHLIGEKLLGKMKTGAAIVNIARGELVDSAALLRHIGRLGFYATDVVEGEAALWLGRPMKVDAVNGLVKKPNFFLVPHIGASTRESQERLSAELVSVISGLARTGV